MTRNKSSFKSENLIVDWIGLDSTSKDLLTEAKQIAKYLFRNFGFNSTFAVELDGKEETLLNDPKNKYKVSFREYKYSDIYWDGIKIDFNAVLTVISFINLLLRMKLIGKCLITKKISYSHV